MSKQIGDSSGNPQSSGTTAIHTNSPARASDWRDMFNQQNFAASRLGAIFGGYVWKPALTSGTSQERNAETGNQLFLSGIPEIPIQGVGTRLEASAYGSDFQITFEIYNADNTSQGVLKTITLTNSTNTDKVVQADVDISWSNITDDFTIRGEPTVLQADVSISDESASGGYSVNWVFLAEKPIESTSDLTFTTGLIEAPTIGFIQDSDTSFYIGYYDWNIWTFDSARDVGSNTAADVDIAEDQDRIHALWVDNNNDAQFEELDTDFVSQGTQTLSTSARNEDAAIVMHDDNEPVVVWNDTASNELKAEKRVSNGDWSNSTQGVINNYNVDRCLPDATLGEDGNVHIVAAPLDTTNSDTLKVAWAEIDSNGVVTDQDQSVTSVSGTGASNSEKDPGVYVYSEKGGTSIDTDNIYLVYDADGDGVKMSESTDGGSSWSEETIINSFPGTKGTLDIVRRGEDRIDVNTTRPDLIYVFIWGPVTLEYYTKKPHQDGNQWQFNEKIDSWDPFTESTGLTYMDAELNSDGLIEIMYVRNDGDGNSALWIAREQVDGTFQSQTVTTSLDSDNSIGAGTP